MTLSIAWIRRIGNSEELVIATDSRLRFGCAWDCCPKIFNLPRSDSAICFAGDTMHAYPIMLQIKNSIEMYPKLHSRAMDIRDARGHFLRLITKMRQYIHDLPSNLQRPEAPETFFIFAGYSWASQAFKIWIIKYDKFSDQFIHETPKTIMKNLIAITGDDVKEIRKRIYALMESRGKKPGDGMDMEPFEILRDKIREESNVAIGGPPQIVKIYKHMNTMPHGVFWPNKESKSISYLGRPVLDYEMIPYPIIDPDTLETETLKIENPEFPRTFDDGANKLK
ncbi:MAG: hypothetical protein R2813_13970 [Flavobacteriales bacterium]